MTEQKTINNIPVIENNSVYSNNPSVINK